MTDEHLESGDRALVIWTARLNYKFRGVSFGAKLALGIVSLFGFMLSALFFFYSGGPLIGHKAIPMFGAYMADALIFGAIGAGCAFTTLRLLQGRTWARWAAFCASVLTLALGSFVFLSSLYPRNDFESSESGFGLGIGFLLIVPSAISSILLGLPNVRRRYSAAQIAASAVTALRE